MLVSYQRPVQSHPSVLDWVFNPDILNRAGAEHTLEETPDGYTVSIDVPGVVPERISLRVQDRAIRLTAKRTIGGKTAERHYRWQLPLSANADAVDATLNHGVLTLNIAKSESSLPRDIEINLAQ